MAELTNPQNTPTGDGATLTIESNSDLGTLYSYSKTTPFTGTDEENAAEIMTNGVDQAPVIGTNTRVVDGQDSETMHYAGWVQDDENVIITAGPSFGTPTTSGATITWATDYAGDSTVNWGYNSSLTETPVTSAGPTTSHSESITTATADTLIYYRVTTVTSANGSVTSNENTFTTDAGGANPYGDKMVFEFTVPTPNYTVVLAAIWGSSASGTIDWDDGSTSDITIHNDPDFTHVYEDAGTYTATFDGTWDKPSFNGASVKPVLTALLNIGDTGLVDVTNCWLNCTLNTGGVSYVANTSAMINVTAAFYNQAAGFDLNLDIWNIENITTWTNFLYSTTLPTARYDLVCQSWGQVQTMANTTDVHMGSSTYSDATAHAALEAQVSRNSNGLNLIDGGPA